MKKPQVLDTQDILVKKFGIKFDRKTVMPLEIPNIGRDNLPELFKELGYKVGAEIGVLAGEFSEKLCAANPELKLFAIDPWEMVDGFDDFDAVTLKKSYETAKERLKNYNCTLIKKTSMDAIKDFADNSLDFVYLDGDHEFKSVAMDISEWIKKVRVGGIISGHDFRRNFKPGIRYHVKEVVTAFTMAFHVKPWFVLGREARIPGEIRDKERSWMWVKTK